MVWIIFTNTCVTPIHACDHLRSSSRKKQHKVLPYTTEVDDVVSCTMSSVKSRRFVHTKCTQHSPDRFRLGRSSILQYRCGNRNRQWTRRVRCDTCCLRAEIREHCVCQSNRGWERSHRIRSKYRLSHLLRIISIPHGHHRVARDHVSWRIIDTTISEYRWWTCAGHLQSCSVKNKIWRSFVEMRDPLPFCSDRLSPWVGHRLFHIRTMSSNFQLSNRYVNKFWNLTCRARIQRKIQVQVPVRSILIAGLTLFVVVVLEVLLSAAAQRDGQEGYLRLRGQMLYIQEWKAIIYLATPVSVTDFDTRTRR